MKERVYSKIVLNFLASSVDYCNLLEDAYGKFSDDEFILEISKSLSLVYISFLNLPQFKEEVQEFEIEDFVAEGDYNYIHSRLAEKFGDNNNYLEIIDPLRLENQEPIGTSIAEYLSDIYQELKNYSTHYKTKSNDSILYLANVQCTENFNEYWGGRLVSVLRALHLISVKSLNKE